MLDPKDIAEDAVLAIDLTALGKIVANYTNYPDRPDALAQFRSSLAIAARRAIDAKPSLEQ